MILECVVARSIVCSRILVWAVYAQMYKTAKYSSAKAIKEAKASYYNGKITKASSDQKVLFKVVDSLE